MAEKISAKLSAINTDIQKIKTSVKEAANETKIFQSGLRLDGNNLQLIVDKFASMRRELQHNTELARKYKEAIAEAETSRGGLNKSSPTYQQDYARYTKDINDYTTALKKAEVQIAGLTAATSKYAENQALAKAATQNTKEKFEQFEKVAKKVSIAMLALVGVMAKVVTSAISTGTELYNLSKRYQANVEDIQKWNKAIQLATGESDVFTNSIKTMQKGITQIANGSGAQYANTLKKIGLSYSDLSGVDNTARFESIVNALAQVANESDRAAYAQQLFGDSGLAVASTIGQGTEALNAYLSRAAEFGTITQTGAERLNELNGQFDLAKSKISEAGADIALSFAPALLTLADIIKEDVAPFLKGIADFLDSIGEGGQKVLLALTVALILLPKLIGFIKGVKTAIDLAKVSTTALNVATASWQVILLAVAAVVLTIISLIAIFSKSAKNALQDVENLKAASNDLAAAGGDFVTGVENHTSETTTRTVILEATIDGKGETPIGDDNAQKVAQLTADELQKRWGDLVK